MLTLTTWPADTPCDDISWKMTNAGLGNLLGVMRGEAREVNESGGIHGVCDKRDQGKRSSSGGS